MFIVWLLQWCWFIFDTLRAQFVNDIDAWYLTNFNTRNRHGNRFFDSYSWRNEGKIKMQGGINHSINMNTVNRLLFLSSLNQFLVSKSKKLTHYVPGGVNLTWTWTIITNLAEFRTVITQCIWYDKYFQVMCCNHTVWGHFSIFPVFS